MRYLASHEQITRGTVGFPVELYDVNQSHPRYEMPLHWHMECEFIRIIDGSFSLTLDSGNRILHAGDTVFLPSGVIHGGTPQHCIYQCLVVDMENLLQKNPSCQEYFNELFHHGTSIDSYFQQDTPCWKLIQHLFQVTENKPYGYELSTIGLLWQFLGEILHQHLYQTNTDAHTTSTKRVTQMKKVLRRIRKDFHSHLTLEDLAAEAAMEKKYFCKVFRQVTGRTPFEYLNYYRIECASELLCHSEESVTAISLSCGFNDLSYFTRMFRRHKGVSPLEYRKHHSH